MEPLPLEGAGYPGSYKLIGGRPSLDLVNTISWRGTPREHDWLAVPANLPLWLQAVGLESNPSVETPDLAGVHHIREVLSDALRPLAHQDGPSPTAVEQLNKILSRSLGRRHIEPERLHWTWASSHNVVEVLDPVVLDAADLIAVGDHERLKYCPSCDWLFEDQTRNGRRRWCDMADCGSRAKARSYYHRHKD